MNQAVPFVCVQETLLQQDRDDHGVVVLTLNRPATRNALSITMLEALDDGLTALAADRQARVIVIAARGEVFSSGHDLKELSARRGDADAGRAFFSQVFELCSRVMQRIVAMPQPVIAAVDGTATAAGCQLVASCDLAVAGAAARFCTPGVNIGLFCSTPMVALSRNVAPKHAMEMLLGGDMIDAATAWRFGLVNRLVAQGESREAALAWARQLAAKPARTLTIGKQAFYRQAELSLSQAYLYAAEVMVTNMLARDAEEGMGAFIEKRQPEWDDR